MTISTKGPITPQQLWEVPVPFDGEPGPLGKEGKEGPEGASGTSLEPQGEWNPGINYPRGNVVSWKGSSFASVNFTNFGNEPTLPPNEEFWMVVSERGATGNAALLAGIATSLGVVAEGEGFTIEPEGEGVCVVEAEVELTELAVILVLSGSSGLLLTTQEFASKKSWHVYGEQFNNVSKEFKPASFNFSFGVFAIS